jgi:hypothetical protein
MELMQRHRRVPGSPSSKNYDQGEIATGRVSGAGEAVVRSGQQGKGSCLGARLNGILESLGVKPNLSHDCQPRPCLRVCAFRLVSVLLVIMVFGLYWRRIDSGTHSLKSMLLSVVKMRLR